MNSIKNFQKSAHVEVKPDPEGTERKWITFTPTFITVQDQEYRTAVDDNITSKIDMPRELFDIVAEGCRSKPTAELLSWASCWGPVQEITSVVLPLLGRDHFTAVADICKHLCSEYQWPIGRQQARKVLPLLAYYRREETLGLIESWMNSGRLFLVKSAAMTLGNVALMKLSLAREMLERILTYPDETVAKEAARAIPNLADVDPALADLIAQRCRSLGLAFVEGYRSSFAGISMSGIPGYLTFSTEVAFEKVELAATIVARVGLALPEINLARNYIFDSILLLAEADPIRLARTLTLLRPFTSESHVQANLLVAASCLASSDERTSRHFFDMAENGIKEPLKTFSARLRERLIA